MYRRVGLRATLVEYRNELYRLARLPGLEDYFRIARDPGTIAVALAGNKRELAFVMSPPVTYDCPRMINLVRVRTVLHLL